MKNKKSEIIVGCLFLLLIASVFFGVNSLKPDKAPPTIQTNPTSSPTPVPAIQSCGNDQCVIKELGIKFATPYGSDLIYIANEKHAWFSTKSLMKRTNDCPPSDEPLGSISKINKSELDESSGNWRTRVSELKRNAHAKVFNDFYVLYEGPQSVCSFNPGDSDMQTAQLQIFKDVTSSIELIK
jgi:hypothetical protein